MHKTLEECRGAWEWGMKPLVVMEPTTSLCTRMLVILDAEPKLNPVNKRYNCHRYWYMGSVRDGEWVCSIDGERVPLEAVFSWLNNPCTLVTQPKYYIIPSSIPHREE